LEPAGKVRLMLRVMLRVVSDTVSSRTRDATALDGPKVGSAPDRDELCWLAARQMITTAFVAERRAYLDLHAGMVDTTGRRLVVGNGYACERTITTAARADRGACPAGG
jgi:putative transposase